MSAQVKEAQEIRRTNFGTDLVIHSVIYPIDYCTSGCTYCGLSALLTRQGAHSIGGQMQPAVFDWILRELSGSGYRVHELVFGTVVEDQRRLTERIARWVARAREADPESYLIVNCDTLRPQDYRTLRSAGADAIWTFIEMMSPTLYKAKHRSGLKADRLQRMEAPMRIRDGGMAVGNALLWGLTAEWERELEDFVSWSREVGGFDFVATPVQQTVTLRQSGKAPDYFDVEPPLAVSPELYLEICSRLRLAFPMSHLVANTRIDPHFVYGQVSAINDMCNGYVWTGARSHPKATFAREGHVTSDQTQMNFFNPGVAAEGIQALCPENIRVSLKFPSREKAGLA
jgi:hypothetical protein